MGSVVVVGVCGHHYNCLPGHKVKPYFFSMEKEIPGRHSYFCFIFLSTRTWLCAKRQADTETLREGKDYLQLSSIPFTSTTLRKDSEDWAEMFL